MQTIGLIGAGNMAYSIISGLINNSYDKNFIKISDANTVLLSQRKTEFDVEIFENNIALVQACDTILIAVKPQVLPEVCREVGSHLGHNPLIISVVAGAKTTDINHWLGQDCAIVRTMPNTPALFNQAITGAFANKQVDMKQKSHSDTILKTIGKCVWVADENLIDVVTAVSGSGPAYFFLLIESMTKAGVAMGLEQSIAEQLSIQTALGSAVMVSQSSDSPELLRIKVSSPNGTTQAAIESFQSQNFEAIVNQAMQCAFERAKKISMEMGVESDNAK